MDRAHSPSRRAFLRNSGGLAAASAMIGVGAAQAQTAVDPEAQTAALTESHYYLTDVRLEEGFAYCLGG